VNGGLFKSLIHTSYLRNCHLGREIWRRVELDWLRVAYI